MSSPLAKSPLDRAPPGTAVTPIAPGLVARVSAGLRYAVSGVTPTTWFGPDQPLAPQAQDAAGRQFDYPVGFNLRTGPREDSALSFRELRALADGYDLVRLAVETRKDQIEASRWQVRPRLKGGARLPANGGDDGRVAAISAFLGRPDGEHGWGTWLRMLVEDLLVIDAPCLYRRRTLGGQLAALEIMDGATIRRVLNADGRTPRAPDVAYQQVLKGLPAVDYTADELIYAPRNRRSSRIYGFSPVEQIATTVNIALRRQLSQLAYYTEGNTPEALIGVPEGWSPDQISSFQNYWDSLLEGNLGQRRRTKFVPGGLNYLPTRPVTLTDEYDEWLARVVCFAFSLPPTPFTRQTNRATAETAQAAAGQEGLAPLQGWVKHLIDRVIAEDFAAPDLEFAWTEAGGTDMAALAQTNKLLVAAGIKTVNEARAELGLDPIPGGDRAVVETATGAVPLAQAGAAPQEAAKLAKFDAAQPRQPSGASGSTGGQFAAVPDGPASHLLTPAQEMILPDPVPDFDAPETWRQSPVNPKDEPAEPKPDDDDGNERKDRDDDEYAKEWADASIFCNNLADRGELNKPFSWYGRSIWECMRGQVSERCGGNPVV